MMPSPAALIGGSRVFKRRHSKWLRQRARGEYAYNPPRGVRVDDETGDLRFELGPAQLVIYHDGTRFRVLVAGRRFGKTHLSVVELTTFALEHPESLCWYIAPLFSMARDLAWDAFKAAIPPWYIDGEPNESRLEIRLVNGSRIVLKGAEHPNRLRGRKLGRFVFDEFPIAKEEAWTAGIRPSLSDLEAGGLMIGTPLGFNWGYDTFRKGLPDYDGEDAAEWKAWQLQTAQGGRIKPAEIAKARAMLSPAMFAQEYGASFTTMAGRVYSYFAEAWHVDATLVDTGGPLLVGMDFNVNPMTATLGVRAMLPSGAIELWVLDEIVLPNSNTAEMAAAIRQHERAQPLQHPDRPGVRLPRPVIVCADPAGKARKTSAAAGTTDHSLLEAAGFAVDAPKAAPLVKDRINNLNALFLSADGAIRCRVHPRCTHLVKALNGLTWNGNVPDPKSPHIHILDALGYTAWQQFNLLEPSHHWQTRTFSLV